MNETAKRAIEQLEHPDFETNPQMEAFARSAFGREMTKQEWIDLWRVLGLAVDRELRKVDPQARNDPNAASVASGMKRGAFKDEHKIDLMNRLLEGQLPEKFLATVERLYSADGNSKEGAYLDALIEFYLTEGKWPNAHALDHHAIALHPEVFPLKGIDGISNDERKAFRRLRKNLEIDWLPEGKSGRPKKNGGHQ